MGVEPTAQMTPGVRGANESTSTNPGWVESEAQIDLEAGRDLLSTGEYDKAITRLKGALMEATDAETPEIQYTLSYAHTMRGDTRDALADIVGVQPSGSESWAPDFVLLKAKLLVDTSAFKQAIGLLVADSPVLEAGGQRSSLYHFLMGLAYRGLGDAESEKDQLSRILITSDHGELATTAEELQKNP